jgi:hypothetical protein
MDMSVLRAELIPGRQSAAASKSAGEVPNGERSALVAAFSAGDGAGGLLAQGRTARRLVPGLPSLVLDSNGRPAVAIWQGDFSPGPTVAAARQGAALLVDSGAPTHGPSTAGARWASGVGVDSCGNLIWAGGPKLSPATLADLLVQAGCSRAMELAIPSGRVTFNAYTPSSLSVRGERLLRSMTTRADRYLTPDPWDFVAVLSRK